MHEGIKYYLEGDSVMEGVNELGYEYFSYILHEVPQSPYAYRHRPDLTEAALGGGSKSGREPDP